MSHRPHAWSKGGSLVGLLGSVVVITTALAGDDPGAARVEFNRDIRPILSDACFRCHGPDRAKRKADLRLDLEEGAFADRDGERPIVPGDPDRSELYQRISSADAEEHMPPLGADRQLSPREVALVRRWIEQGARWQKHWSLIPPRRPSLPEVAESSWPSNPIDRFVLAALTSHGLAPSPEAAKTTLIRRVTFDLTGLPPTPAEVDAFLADDWPNAYERVVDRLLASPRYGERMAIRWIDAARYADTNGYQTDGDREMWRWRDWVIDAFNANMPFDGFTIEQLAGDMLPGATLDQKIASGFNRNHRGNGEGGIIPEEFAVEYVVDRVDTTATVWLGLTMACARCHDHKYDPIAQKEFYRLFAFFNNIPEKGRAVKVGNSPPLIPAPTRAQQERLAKLDHEIEAAARRVVAAEPDLAASQSAWESMVSATTPIDWTPAGDVNAHFALDSNLRDETSTTRAVRVVDGKARFVPGPIGHSAEFDGERAIEAADAGDFGYFDKFSIAAWVQPTRIQGGTMVSRMTDAEQADGYAVLLDGGRVGVNLVKRWLDDALRVRTVRALSSGEWHHVVVSYDGSSAASGVKVYIDGRLEPLEVLLDELNQSFKSKEPLRIGGGGGPEARFRGRIDDVRIYGRVLSADEAAILSAPDTIQAIAARPPRARSHSQTLKIRAYYLENDAPAAFHDAHRALAELREQRARLVEAFPTTMVMQEMPSPRQTFVLKRGEYDKPGEPVQPGVPSCLTPFPPGARATRLDLARWLVDPANPLTARVAVNRAWQMFFGTGLVKTVDDFGSQGEPPSHPELLEWLATEFMVGGWNVKALHRAIVTSATYRQSSRANSELLRNDPDNRLLARGPRIRLPAEMIRDQALAASGLLVERLGGPSVKPYQPDGLWKELTDAEYVQDHGARLYRRSLYTFWKRTVSPPAMVTFDAAARETCTVRETRTNTPLQALTLLNDVTFVESARVLAERIMKQGATNPEDRITLAFRLATARNPSAHELEVLAAGFRDHLAHYRAQPQDAKRLTEAGESARDAALDQAELAAYTATTSLILNLDETITKE
jgi:hypothetical protein